MMNVCRQDRQDATNVQNVCDMMYDIYKMMSDIDSSPLYPFRSIVKLRVACAGVHDNPVPSNAIHDVSYRLNMVRYKQKHNKHQHQPKQQPK